MRRQGLPSQSTHLPSGNSSDIPTRQQDVDCKLLGSLSLSRNESASIFQKSLHASALSFPYYIQFFSVIQTNSSSRNTYTRPFVLQTESSAIQRAASVIQRAPVCITERLVCITYFFPVCTTAAQIRLRKSM